MFLRYVCYICKNHWKCHCKNSRDRYNSEVPPKKNHIQKLEHIKRKKKSVLKIQVQFNSYCFVQVFLTSIKIKPIWVHLDTVVWFLLCTDHKAKQHNFVTYKKLLRFNTSRKLRVDMSVTESKSGTSNCSLRALNISLILMLDSADVIWNQLRWEMSCFQERDEESMWPERKLERHLELPAQPPPPVSVQPALFQLHPEIQHTAGPTLSSDWGSTRVTYVPVWSYSTCTAGESWWILKLEKQKYKTEATF